MNPVINILMQKLQKINPSGYNMVNQMMQNGGDPNALLNQIMGGTTPEQRQQILNTAKSYRSSRKRLKQNSKYEIVKNLFELVKNIDRLTQILYVHFRILNYKKEEKIWEIIYHQQTLKQ